MYTYAEQSSTLFVTRGSVMLRTTASSSHLSVIYKLACEVS
jgi:hypothetical protein